MNKRVYTYGKILTIALVKVIMVPKNFMTHLQKNYIYWSSWSDRNSPKTIRSNLFLVKGEKVHGFPHGGNYFQDIHTYYNSDILELLKLTSSASSTAFPFKSTVLFDPK